jgi:hypothetical protein
LVVAVGTRKEDTRVTSFGPHDTQRFGRPSLVSDPSWYAFVCVVDNNALYWSSVIRIRLGF